MKRLLASAAMLPLFLLAACDNTPPASSVAPAASRPATDETRTVATPAADPNAANFQHDPKLDVSGFYLTQTPVQSGNWKLTSIFMGSPSDFASWEEGKRPSNFGPFFLEFEDVTSPTVENELGQTVHTGRFRLQPDSYKVGAGQVTFHGSDSRVGEVLFSGGMDLATLKTMKAAGPGVPMTMVLTGGLQVGAERIRNISFFYFAGD